MTDSSLNQFVTRGTAAARVAFTPTPPLSSSGYFWFETDTSDSYAWSGAAWVKVNSGGPTSGTWTPALSFGGASVGITYTDQIGFYTQIGKLVFCAISLQLSNKGSSTGAAVISGLPVAAASGTHKYQSIPMQVCNSPPTWGGYIGIAGAVANTAFAVYTAANAAMTNANFANTSQMIAGFSYMTD